MRSIKFKYVIKVKDRIEISKPFSIEEIDEISCMFEDVIEYFTEHRCRDIGHSQFTCDCFDDFYRDGEIIARPQYTGSKDNSNTEIYEGDIVHSHTDNDDFVITFEDGSFALENIDGSNYLYITDHTISNCEIIGNIYENQELLNETK